MTASAPQRQSCLKPVIARASAVVMLGSLLLAAPGPTSAATDHAADPGALPCGEPVLVDGQPRAVVVLVDGVNSVEEAGSVHPVPVADPAPGTPVVADYCPVTADGADHSWPDGIRMAMNKWSKRNEESTSETPTSACAADDGLQTDRCLVARLADTGAVMLPYSYNGATLRQTAHGPILDHSAYDAQDTHQSPATSIDHLDTMIDSIVSTWPDTRIYVIAHSLGGMISEGWWFQEHKGNTFPTQVKQVSTLDSPINGMPKCLLASLVVGFPLGNEFCRRWNHRDAFDEQRMAFNADQTLTTFGTPNDETYSDDLTAGGGHLRTQLIYGCADQGRDPASTCIAHPHSVVSPCDPRTTPHEGSGHSLVIECPQVVRELVRGPAAAAG